MFELPAEVGLGELLAPSDEELPRRSNSQQTPAECQVADGEHEGSPEDALIARERPRSAGLPDVVADVGLGGGG